MEELAGTIPSEGTESGIAVGRALGAQILQRYPATLLRNVT